MSRIDCLPVNISWKTRNGFWHSWSKHIMLIILKRQYCNLWVYFHISILWNERSNHHFKNIAFHLNTPCPLSPFGSLSYFTLSNYWNLLVSKIFHGTNLVCCWAWISRNLFLASSYADIEDSEPSTSTSMPVVVILYIRWSRLASMGQYFPKII